MDGDFIGIMIFALLVFGLIIAGVVWARRRDLRRRKAVIDMVGAIGFEMIKDNNPPENFPLASFPAVRWGEKGVRRFSNAAHGDHSGREVLFFDYFLLKKPCNSIEVLVGQTIVAARGEQECFLAAKSDAALQLETEGGWTIAYWPMKLLDAEETRSLVLSIAGKAERP